MDVSVAALSSQQDTVEALIYIRNDIMMDTVVPKGGFFRIPREILARVFEELHQFPSKNLDEITRIVKSEKNEDPLSDLLNLALSCKTLTKAAFRAKVLEVFPVFRPAGRLPSAVRAKIMRPCHGCNIVWVLGGYHSAAENWCTFYETSADGYRGSLNFHCPGTRLLTPSPQTRENITENGVVHDGLLARRNVGAALDPDHPTLKMWLGNGWTAKVKEHDRKTCEGCIKEFGPEPPARPFPTTLQGLADAGLDFNDPAFINTLRRLGFN